MAPPRALPFSAGVFQLVLFASLPKFADWHASARERLAHCLLPQVPRLGNDLPVREFERLYELVCPQTMLDVFRLAMIARLLDRCLEQEGDVFECGAGPGGLSLLMALLIRSRGLGKRVWVFDSFEGLPAPDRNVDRAYSAGACAYAMERVRSLMRQHGVEDCIEIRKGWLSDTLPALDKHQRFCFGHIDVDLYASTRDATRTLYDRLGDGSALVFDDYYDGSGGVFKAVNEAAAHYGEVVHLGPTCQAFFLKRVSAPTEWRIVGSDAVGAPLSVPASCEHLRVLPGYREFLRETHAALTPRLTWLLSLLSPSLLPHPLNAARPSLEAYLALLDDAPNLDDFALALEPGGILVREGKHRSTGRPLS
jgi:hypothetical protein